MGSVERGSVQRRSFQNLELAAMKIRTRDGIVLVLLIRLVDFILLCTRRVLYECLAHTPFILVCFMFEVFDGRNRRTKVRLEILG